MAKKAIVVANRIRSKAAMVLEAIRKDHDAALAREIQERECRLHRALESTQEKTLQVELQKEQVLAHRG